MFDNFVATLRCPNCGAVLPAVARGGGSGRSAARVRRRQRLEDVRPRNVLLIEGRWLRSGERVAWDRARLGA